MDGEGYQGEEYYEPTNDSSEYYFEKYYLRPFNEARNELKSQIDNNYEEKIFDQTWEEFEEDVKQKNLRIKKKPKYFLAWFSETTVKEDLKYTFEKYAEENRKEIENEIYGDKKKQYISTRRWHLKNQIQSKKNYDDFLKDPENAKFMEKMTDFFPELFAFDTTHNFIKNKFFSEKLSKQEYFDKIIEYFRRKFNEKVSKFNEIVKEENYYEYEKELILEGGKQIDEISTFLKPYIQDYEARKGKISREFQEKIVNYEKEIVDARRRYDESVSKLSMLKAKTSQKNTSLFKKIKELKNQKEELEKRISGIKSETSEKRAILNSKKQKIQNQIDDLQKLIDKNNLDLKKLQNFKISESFSKSDQEKIARLQELEKKSLNETSIREKNAILRSLEFEKVKEEIRLREEQRYQEEQREKEELKQAKIVFLKEKKIIEKKIKAQKAKEKYFSDRKKDVDNLEKKKEEIKLLLSQTQSHLQKVKLETEQKKLKTLEIEKQTLFKKQDYAKQQKLFQDSIALDVDELENQKKLLSDIVNYNKKILQNTKKELSARQLEIEKNISLNMQTLKLRESNILKLKLDVKNTLSDLKDEIIRKEDVSSLLSETIDKISTNEISEVKNYNAYLESEINFKQKLTNETLSHAEKKEIIAEEKEDLIERLEHVKSQKLKKIYQLREKAIEQQMRIFLIEESENLKSQLFSLKYDIKNLNYEKELSERKEDLINFQSDNLKKELNLRKQEIELLKNIREKVLVEEIKTRQTETRKAISDIEKNERNQDVRQKMDEILDDVENQTITKDVRHKVSDILDKIENKEIKESAKEKLDFILDKIEIHENVDESKKALNNILDKIEDKQIKKDIDEIIDDVVTEDFDFLKDDEFDNFLSSVKKHLKGEKKMKQFSKIETIVAEERKIKMEENIEMKDLDRKVGPEDYEVGETSFADYDYNLFVNAIEDFTTRAKVKEILDKEDGFEKDEKKSYKMKDAYKKVINEAWWNDKLDTNYWDGNLIQDEQAKFKYEQKLNNLNTALADYDLHLDPSDVKVREFLDIQLLETFSEKRGEINGYKYLGEKIISRNISRNFFFNYIKKPAQCQAFIDALKQIINQTAKSQISAESYFEKSAVKDCAMEYIGELREEQSYQIDSARNGAEMRDALREANDIENEISQIKKNLPFKMRLKIFRRTLSYRFTKLLRFLWKHKGKSVSIIGGLLIASIGFLLNQLGVISIVNHLKSGLKTVKQYSQDVHDMGKRIIQNVQALYRIPGTIVGYIFIVLSIFLRLVYFTTRLSGTYSSAAVFGALGVTFEALIYFEGSAEKINEKVADAMEETGNIIENAGIRAQKYIIKNSPKWYWNKPTEKKTILEIVESGASKMIFSVAKGTQKAGKKVEEVSETVRSSVLYLKIFILLLAAFLAINFVRNNFLLNK